MGKITINELSNSLRDYIENNTENKQDKTDSSLKTTDKTIVGAINELFQNVDSGKQLIATAIDDSSITKDSTFDAMGTAITLLHNQIANLTNELAGKVTPTGTAVAANVLSGKTFINSTGQTVTGTMANQGAKTFTPSASKQTGAAGYYSGITVNTDSNLVAANIVSGKKIFGVTGSATISSLGGKQFASGSNTVISLSGVEYGLVIKSLSFKPSCVVWWSDTNNAHGVMYSFSNKTKGVRMQGSGVLFSLSVTSNPSDTGVDSVGFYSNGFKIHVIGGSSAYSTAIVYWYAFS